MKFHPFLKLSATLFLLLSFHLQLFPNTIVSGNISGIWTKAGSPYLINGTSVIIAGETLTIEPGVEVIFNSYAAHIIVEGTLDAVGAVNDSISMYHGVAYISSSPTISFNENSGGRLEFVKLIIPASSSTSYSFISIFTDDVKISSCSVYTNKTRVIAIKNESQPYIFNNSANGEYFIEGAPSSFNNIENNEGTIFYLGGSLSKNATIKKGKTAYPHIIYSRIDIPEDIVFTLEPGVKITSLNEVIINKGTIVAKGTQQDSIYFLEEGLKVSNQRDFTSVLIDFSTESKNNHLEFASFSYKRSGSIKNNTHFHKLVIRTSSLTITNSLFSNLMGRTIGVVGSTTKPSIYNNKTEHIIAPLLLLSFKNLEHIYSNENFGIEISDNPDTEVVIKHQGKGSYYEFGKLIIPKGIKVKLSPGVKIEVSNRNNPIAVFGGIESMGSEESPVIFSGISRASFQESSNGYIIIQENYDSLYFKNTIFEGVHIYTENKSYTPKPAGFITFDSCHFSKASVASIVTYQEVVTVRNSDIYNSQVGFRSLSAGSYIIENCRFNNVSTGLDIGSVTTIANNNYWGDPTGPYHRTLNPGGKGVQINGNVLFDPWQESPHSKLSQNIVFPRSGRAEEDALTKVPLMAYSSSNLSVRYELSFDDGSSENEIASIKDDTLYFHGAGIFTVTAIQDGNERYKSTQLSQTMIVRKLTQRIVTDYELHGKLKDSFYVMQSYTSLHVLPLKYQALNNKEKVRISNDTVFFREAGKLDLRVYNDGSIAYEPVSTNVSMNIYADAPDVKAFSLRFDKEIFDPNELVTATLGLTNIGTADLGWGNRRVMIYGGVVDDFVLHYTLFDGRMEIDAIRLGDTAYIPLSFHFPTRVDKDNVFTIAATVLFPEESFLDIRNNTAHAENYYRTTGAHVLAQEGLFQVIATNPVCENVKDGFFTIISKEEGEYVAEISHAQWNQSIEFRKEVKVPVTQSGTYQISIHRKRKPGDKVLLTSSIRSTESKLMVQFFQNSNNSMVITLAGGSKYLIQVNNKIYTTSESRIEVPIYDKDNKISVRSNITCQGIIEHYFSQAQPIIVYPNPFISQFTFINPFKAEALVEITVSDENGKIVFRNSAVNPLSTITINLPNVASGFYFLRVSNDKKSHITKILKK